jgi:hypothetical protein
VSERGISRRFQLFRPTVWLFFGIRCSEQIGGQEQQVLTVLQFVQEQVRYFGIEIGSSATKPANPSVVFARRFGDCKDKSLLFVTIKSLVMAYEYQSLADAVSAEQASQTVDHMNEASQLLGNALSWK